MATNTATTTMAATVTMFSVPATSNVWMGSAKKKFSAIPDSTAATTAGARPPTSATMTTARK
jgi:hypothetical protein